MTIGVFSSPPPPPVHAFIIIAHKGSALPLNYSVVFFTLVGFRRILFYL